MVVSVYIDYEKNNKRVVGAWHAMPNGITDFNLIDKQDIAGILIFDYKLLSKRKTAGN